MLITSGQSENVSICGPSSIAICSPVSDTTVGPSSSLFTSCDQNGMFFMCKLSLSVNMFFLYSQVFMNLTY